MSADNRDSNAAEHDALEDQLDLALLKLARVEQANEETVPVEVVRRLSEGEVPLTVWREHRRLSKEQLSVAAQVPVDLLQALENGKEDVPLRTMQAIARVLHINLDDLVPWSQDAAH
jgi:DNA-binding Xre family transcriptional regulator